MKIIKNDIEFEVTGENAGFFNHYINETWESYTWNIMRRFLTKNTIYFDVGAWIGITCIPASFNSKKCYAFEPDPVAFKELKNNIELNNFQNINIYNMAISDYDGDITLGNPSRLGDSMTRRFEKINSFTLPCMRLNTFCNNVCVDMVDFIKIDVEGSEELISRDFEFFEKFRPITYVSFHHDWFINKDETYKNFERISKLYRNHYDINLNRTQYSNKLWGVVFVP